MEVGTSFLPPTARMNSGQLCQLYQAMFMTSVSDEMVRGSIASVCGEGVKVVDRPLILPVLQEIHDHRVLEENAYWDFRALVMNDNQTLTPKDALLFLRVLHGDKFSTTHWERFVASRVDPGADVSWFEIKPWVCSIPREGDAAGTQYKALEDNITSVVNRRSKDTLSQYDSRNKTKHAKEMFEYSQRVKRKARNKLNLWEQGGLEPFLGDDDSEHYQDSMKKDKVNPSDILDLIEEKYSRLRQTLLKLMMQRFSGETTWEILSDLECNELVDEIITEERRLRLSGLLPGQCQELPGAAVVASGAFTSLSALMDEVEGGNGKHSSVVPKANEYWLRMSGARESFGQHLVGLLSRFTKEQELYKSGARKSKQAKCENELYFCQLHRQLLQIDSRPAFSCAALAVGLAERSRQHEYHEIDRSRREHLAALELSSHESHHRHKRNVSTSNMTTAEINALGGRDLFVLLVRQIHERHKSECQVMRKLLTHQTSRSHKSLQSALPKEEVVRQLTMLSNQRATWRDTDDEFKTVQKDEHYRVLQQALSVYYEAEAKPMFSEYSAAEQVNSAVLALLQRVQGQEFDKLITEISRKKKTALIETLKAEEAATKHDYCDNIAAILFGSVESSELDKLYVENLMKKYLAIRHQLVQYSLSKKFGDSWYSRSVDDQQRHIAKLAISLKEQQDQGKISAMDAVVADSVQNISVYQCMGENRLQFEKRLRSEQPHAAEVTPTESGVFAALHSRYFGEYAAVLEHAHRVGEVDPNILLALLRAETFIIEQSGNLRIALFSAGLVERIGGVISKRHSEDLIRVGNLAKCLVSSHRLLWRVFGKQAKPKPDIYCDNNSSLTQWVECILKEMLSKHFAERNMLLRILLDDSLKDLRDVADLLPKEEQHRRLVALQNTQRWLLFDTMDARDENIAILEEAAAIQMCVLYDSLVETGQPADTDSIATLLAERLLQLQEKQLAFMLKNIEGASKEELMKLHSDEAEARSTETCKNVAKVLTNYTGLWSDELIFSEIETKYSLLESLMLESVLMTSHDDWDRLDPASKSNLCRELKSETKKYRLAGDIEALTKLYSIIFTDDTIFLSLFGENSFEFSRKIVDFQNVENVPKYIYAVAEEAVAVKDPLAALSERREEEMQAYKNLLRGMYEVFLGEQGRAAEVIKLRHHQSLIKCSADFAKTATTLGLKERSQLVTHISKGTGDHRMLLTSDWDRILRLAAKTIEDGDISAETIASITGQSTVASSLFVGLLHSYIMRQKKERVRLPQLVSNLPQSCKDSASLQSIDEKLQSLSLTFQRNCRSDAWTVDIVNVACGLKLSLWQEFGSEENPTNFLLGELEEKQLFEVSNLIYTLAEKSVQDLEKLKERFNDKASPCIYRALTDTSHFAVKLDTLIPKAIEDKYETLRAKLLLNALMKQAGDADWAELAGKERRQQLFDLRLKERQLWHHGAHDEATDLFRQHLVDADTRDHLMGDEREDSDCRMKERLARREKRVADGLSEAEAESLENSEASKDEEDMRSSRRDILSYLHSRREKELRDVLADISTMENADQKESKEQGELAKIRRSQRCIRREEQFGAAAMLLKLGDKHTQTEEGVRRLQEQLARERMAARKNAARDSVVAAEDVHMPEADDIIPLREAVIIELELRHLDEREALMHLIEQAPASEYYEQSVSADKTAQEVRLTELKEQRRQLRDSAYFSVKEHEVILQEGVCYRIQLRGASLKSEGASSDADDITASLLADVQQLQDCEMEMIVSDVQHKTAKSLRELKVAQEKSRSTRWHDSVATAVLTCGSISNELDPERELIDALTEKYDAMKDKLILEGLLNQMGEAEWNELTERQRQQKLMELKMQEKRLREEGKLDEARQLLNGLVDAEQGLDSMKADQEKMLQERAEKLKKRLQSQSGDKDKIRAELNEVEEKLKRTSVLDNLEYELESEKDRLMALLHSQTDTDTAERMKQLEMAKLRRQKNLLKREGELDEASALMHLAMKNEENRLAGLGSDKDMQMELARRRLAARRARAAANQPEPDVTDDSVLAKVQDRVLAALEKKHSTEKDMLMNLLTSADEEDYLEQVQHISNVKLRKALEDLENQCGALQTLCKTKASDCSKEKAELEKLLSKAFLYRLMVDLRAAYGDQENEHTPDRVREACVTLLASLQESQDNECTSTNQLMVSEEDAVLEKLADAYNTATERGQFDNLISVLFAVLDDDKKWSDQEHVHTMDEQFEKEKQELLDAIKSGDDVMMKDGKEHDAQVLLKELEAEHAAQKNAHAMQMEKQNEMMMARRKSKKKAKFDNSCDVAKRLLEELAANDTLHKAAHEDDKDKQGDMMRERLAQRRAARLQQEELEKQDELTRRVRPKTAKDAFGNVMQFVPPIMGMKRERTVVVEVSDEQKEQEWKKLLIEKDLAEKNVSQEQRKQEEMIRARREQRKQRKHSEVEAIFSMGEKQKTMFERSSSENREKQLSMVKERIARIQNEKTMTSRPSRKSTSFEHLVDAGAAGTSKDEQMKNLAANLQKRFADESLGVKEGQASLNIGTEGEQPQPTKILTLEEKQQILKERRLAKRKNRAAAAEPEEDD